MTKRNRRRRQGRDRRDLRCEWLEVRFCLATTSGAGGIDAIALGDVNGDQVADIAVARHTATGDKVTIYDGNGIKSKATATKPATATGYRSKDLATIDDPIAGYTGPLSIALGDFLGTGKAQLAVAPAAAATGSTAPGISLLSFTNTSKDKSPVDSAVCSTVVSSDYLPATMPAATGFHLAADYVAAAGTADLVAAPATGGGSAITVQSIPAGSKTWQLQQTIVAPVDASAGLSVATGRLLNDGATDIAVGSLASGTVGIFNASSGKWMLNQVPLGAGASGTQVALTSGVNQVGALVATGADAEGAQEVAVQSGTGAPATVSTLASDPGNGQGSLVLASGGMVYQRSTISHAATSSATSSGPVTPTVLFGSTAQPDSIVVQGFTSGGTPGRADTYVEPLIGAPGLGFVPLQPKHDPALGQTTAAASTASSLPMTDSIRANLVVVPTNQYHSPYSIDLSSAPAGFDAGLDSTAPVTSTTASAWGPANTPNKPPTITAATITDELRQRVLAAYASAIGVDYQHHHIPFWLPAQGSTWNSVATVGYQSEGIDCTNLTAWAYGNALGITLPSAVGKQAAVTGDNSPGVVIPAAMKKFIDIQTISSSTWTVTPAAGANQAEVNQDAQESYQKLLATLQPGDIMIIDGMGLGTPPTHAITWLGSFGVDSNHQDTGRLIVDSTGITPDHIDSNGVVVPEGVHIRPFGDPSSENPWYFTHVDHILRIVAS